MNTSWSGAALKNFHMEKKGMERWRQTPRLIKVTFCHYLPGKSLSDCRWQTLRLFQCLWCPGHSRKSHTTVRRDQITLRSTYSADSRASEVAITLSAKNGVLHFFQRLGVLCELKSPSWGLPQGRYSAKTLTPTHYIPLSQCTWERTRTSAVSVIGEENFNYAVRLRGYVATRRTSLWDTREDSRSLLL